MVKKYMGPKAPKDAEKNRSWFYIMQNKEVFSQPQPDGSYIHPVYQNDGRLISCAKITGNIEDEVMLDLLKTSEGFRKLVHSIGISADADCNNKELGFVFQMYGAHNVYGGGANFEGKVSINGTETRIYLNDFPKTEDEKEPGQIRFVFPEKDMLVTVKVKLYLNDGFNAPEPIEENPVDTSSTEYKKMIQKSLLSKGNLARLKSVMKKASLGEEVIVSYIGGSITQGAGATPINTECYAYKSFCGFKKLTNGSDNVKYVKAGVGGTPSQLGVLRFDRDVVRDKYPDLVVIEFAVNDEGDETKGDCYESLVKKALALPNKPAVILLFAVFANDWNLQDRLAPVGYHYDIPMVSVLNAVSPQFALKPGCGRVVSKNAFFYDRYHPANIGHTIMADCIINLFEETLNSNDTDNTEELLKKEPVIGSTFNDVVLFDRKDFVSCSIEEGSFNETDTQLQRVEMDMNLSGTPEFPYNWMFDGKKNKGEVKPFTLNIKCKSLMVIFKDSAELYAGKAKVTVDGKKEYILDPHVNGWVHCNPVVIVKGDTCINHEIVISPVEEDFDKQFTILGFGATF